MSTDKHTTERKQSTLGALAVTNILLGLLAASFAIAFIYIEFFYQPDVDPRQTAKYAEEAQERLDQHADEIQKEVAALASETVPPITEAVYARAKRDYPKYMDALQEESDEYLANVEKMFIEKVKAQYREYLAAHRDVLKKEFPEHASEENVEKVMREFEQTFDRLVERYYLDEFRREAKRTRTLWAKFEPLPAPGPNEPSLQEQLADYTADWTVIALAEEGEDVATSETAPN
jgi:hypothetical protein